MSQNINIAIIEDNKVFTTAITKMIEFCTDMTCTAAFGNTEDCLKSVETGELPETDVILLDLHLPGKNGLTLVPLLKKARPEMDILVLTQDDDYLTTLEAIRLGVSGYILKTASTVDVRSAIREVNAGCSVIDPQLSRIVLTALSSENFGGENPLSERETEVLELMAMGYVKKEVSAKLDISYSAVARYTERIYNKLQVPNVAAAVATAIRKGLI